MDPNQPQQLPRLFPICTSDLGEWPSLLVVLSAGMAQHSAWPSHLDETWGAHQARHSNRVTFESNLACGIHTGRVKTPQQLIQRDVTELQLRKATKKSRI